MISVLIHLKLASNGNPPILAITESVIKRWSGSQLYLEKGNGPRGVGIRPCSSLSLGDWGFALSNPIRLKKILASRRLLNFKKTFWDMKNRLFELCSKILLKVTFCLDSFQVHYESLCWCPGWDYARTWSVKLRCYDYPLSSSTNHLLINLSTFFRNIDYWLATNFELYGVSCDDIHIWFSNLVILFCHIFLYFVDH